MSNAGYLIPDEPQLLETGCLLVFYPNDPLYLQALLGSITYLGTWTAWERDEAKRGQLAAAAWKEANDITLSSMNCFDDLITALNGIQTAIENQQITIDPASLQLIARAINAVEDAIGGDWNLDQSVNFAVDVPLYAGAGDNRVSVNDLLNALSIDTALQYTVYIDAVEFELTDTNPLGTGRVTWYTGDAQNLYYSTFPITPENATQLRKIYSPVPDRSLPPTGLIFGVMCDSDYPNENWVIATLAGETAKVTGRIVYDSN